jgi:PGAP1-like protein
VALRVLLRAFLLALILFPLGGGLTAVAEDGPPPLQADDPPSSTRIPVSGLRPAGIPTSTPAPAFDLGPASLVPLTRQPSEKTLVIFVGGYGSSAHDHAFDELATRFRSDRYDTIRFGEDPAFPYDTYGSLDRSAGALAAQIRALGPRYSSVSIVSHSMGGAVTDRAFSSGLSRYDRVQTYVAIAAPHNGADLARFPSYLLPRIKPVANIVRAFFLVFTRDPDSEASRDLAGLRPSGPPSGVTRLDISLATDGFVNARDAFDPGVQQRVLMPGSLLEAVEGHGGSLESRSVGDLVAETVSNNRVPPERRSAAVVVLAGLLWAASEKLALLILGLLCIGAIGLCLVRTAPTLRRMIDAGNSFCGKLVRALGR